MVPLGIRSKPWATPSIFRAFSEQKCHRRVWALLEDIFGFKYLSTMKKEQPRNGLQEAVSNVVLALLEVQGVSAAGAGDLSRDLVLST